MNILSAEHSGSFIDLAVGVERFLDERGHAFIALDLPFQRVHHHGVRSAPTLLGELCDPCLERRR